MDTMICLNRVWCFFCIVSVFAGLSAAFEWKSREFLYVTGCAGSNVTIPWHYQADIGETIDTIYWTHGPRQSMASFYKQTFTSQNTKLSSSPLHVAALQMSSVQVTDTGYYSVQVTVLGPLPGAKVTYNASALLTVSEAPEIFGGSLEVTEVTSSDPCSQRQQRTLSCGYILNRGFPPVDVLWTDPVGQLLPSTRFQKNRFDLDLPLRPLLGNYSCRLNCQAAVRTCLSPGAPLRGLYYLRPLADDGCPWREGEVVPSLGGPEEEEEQGEKSAIDASDVLWQNVTDLREALQSLQDQLLQAESREKEREDVVHSLTTQLQDLRDFVEAEHRTGPTTTTSLPDSIPESAALEVAMEQMNQVRSNLTQLADDMQLLQQQMTGQGGDLRTLRAELKQSQQQIAGQEGNLRTLRVDLNQTQEQISDHDDKLQTFRTDLEQTQQEIIRQDDSLRILSSDLNQTHDRHLKDVADLLARVEVMEERQLTVTTPTLTTPGPLPLALTTSGESQAQELSDLSRALVNLSERVDKQCSLVSVHAQVDLTLLEARLGSLDRKVHALHPGTPMPAEVDPLVSTLRPSFALRLPSVTEAVVQDFAFTRDGQVLLALDRIVLTRNYSTSQFIARPLKHGAFLRCVTALEDGQVAATVDDRYIVMLDTGALDSEDYWEGERWLATDSLYYGIAARSPQTLYASVIMEDSAEGKARIDVITINEDRTVVISTLLTNDVIQELMSPRGLTLHQDALYASDWDSNVVIRYDLTSREASVIAGPASVPQLNFYQPRHTAFDVTGNMYVSTGGSVCGGRDLYSEGFCVLVIAREGAWRRLLRLGPHVYPYGIAVTPTGLAVSWASYVSSQPQSLLQWYDYVLPAQVGGDDQQALLSAGRPTP